MSILKNEIFYVKKFKVIAEYGETMQANSLAFSFTGENVVMLFDDVIYF